MKDYEKAYMTEKAMRDASHKLKRDQNYKAFRHVLRVQIQFLNNSIGEISYNEKKHRRDLEDAGVEESTGNHLAIFEVELKQPPVMSLIEISVHELLMSNRLNFSQWRIVDLDNYMKGNPPYSDFLEQMNWDTEYQSYEETKMAKQGYSF